MEDLLFTIYNSPFTTHHSQHMSQYSQIRAMLAVSKASLVATFRSPQSIFFSLFFPIVLIWIFGSLSGGGGGVSAVDVAFERGIDSTSVLYFQMKNHPLLKIEDPKKKDIEEELRKGRIAAVIDIQKADTGATPYVIHLRTSSASQREYGMLQSVLSNIIHSVDELTYTDRQTVARVEKSEIAGRKYKMIDFFLPG